MQAPLLLPRNKRCPARERPSSRTIQIAIDAIIYGSKWMRNDLLSGYRDSPESIATAGCYSSPGWGCYSRSEFSLPGIQSQLMSRIPSSGSYLGGGTTTRPKWIRFERAFALDRGPPLEFVGLFARAVNHRSKQGKSFMIRITRPDTDWSHNDETEAKTLRS